MAFVDILIVILGCLIAAVAFLTVVFLMARKLGRFDVIDMAWGMTFITIAGISFLQGPMGALQILVSGMVLVWGVRLSGHIFDRIRHTATEDKRYIELRSKWRTRHPVRTTYFRIYLVQAALAALVSLPVIIVNTAPETGVSPLAWAGYGLWLVGMLIEVNADAQLRQFIKDPTNKGRLMTRGLWAYSRHPNYFGEIFLWWGIGVVSLAVPYGWIGIIGPLTITSLIVFVSGIPPAERASASRAGWEAYKRRTSVLIPWFPRKESA